ncbi:hypothetical protein DV515_00017593 [Chloebia gouldiae]|uniref:Saposin B-type domain-containing protein n=1 Tax=Chloebia gouldiae TaxID=44316 RepID=A0A3L8Q9V2_CHLGU|nr:hypothetical protein DV515_00017593 [Chloebia gouldiae]
MRAGVGFGGAVWQDACTVCQKIIKFLGHIYNQSDSEVALEGSGLAPKALPLPLPLCWLCRSLVARAEAAVPVGSVAAAAAELCRALPLPVAGACQCLAERYAALALEGLLGRLGPRLLCRLFLACRSGDSGDSGDNGDTPPPWVLEAVVVRLADCVREEVRGTPGMVPRR